MGLAILGISGSPVENSDTDRLIKVIPGAAGLNGEFVKLGVGPSMPCRGRVRDNRCKVNDGFPASGTDYRKQKAHGESQQKEEVT